jgi:prepilin-type N-terminal cleavage/methylation domain-containing protein
MIEKEIKKSGFTLVELLVTLAIVTILIGITAPKISALFPDSEAVISNRFRHAIIRARWAAARDQVPVQVSFDLEKQMILISEEESVKGKKEWKRLLKLKMPAGTKMTGFQEKGVTSKKTLLLRFFPDGRGEGFGIYLERGTTRLTVMGFPFRPGVEIARGWVEGSQNEK